MAPAINLAGRLPVVTKAISNRLVVVAVLVGLLVLGAIVFGFRYRIKQQESRKEHQQTVTVASDASQSNRAQVQGPVLPPSNLGGLPVAPEQSSPSVRTTQNPSLPGNTTGTAPVSSGGLGSPSAPYPAQPMPAAPALPFSYVPTQSTPVDRGQQLRDQAISRRAEREQQAIEGPTGLHDQRSNGAPPADPQQAELAQLNALMRPALTAQTTSPPIPYPQVAAGIPTNPEQEGGQGYRSQNAQAEKRQFQDGAEGPAEDYLKATRTRPLSRWVVQRGTVIPATLPHRIVSDLPGDLIAEVARDIYDSPTQKYVEIPAGSRLVGEYNSNVSYGQSRVQIVWTAIYFPDGTFIDLDRMPSHGADGSTGLKDQVDNHWSRTVAGVALSSLLSAGLQISQNRTNASALTYPSTGQVAAAGIGTQAAQLGQQLTNRNLNVQPTLKIRPGEIFSVSVKKDILFPGPYEPLEVK